MMINRTVIYSLFTVAWSAMLLNATLIRAEPAPDSGVDCSTVNVDYDDDPSLTRAEKLALMEKALYESLNKFEQCSVSSQSNSSSNASGGGASAGGESGSSAGNAGGGSAVANDAMQGTEPENTDTPSSAVSDAASETEQGGGANNPGGNAASNNGKIPEDIPPAANDDAIAAQIRLAAEAETDPEVRKKLWDEYRKYKGMNVEH